MYAHHIKDKKEPLYTQNRYLESFHSRFIEPLWESSHLSVDGSTSFGEKRDFGLRSATLLKKRLWHRCFPVNFAKVLRTPFLTEQDRWLLVEKEQKWIICRKSITKIGLLVNLRWQLQNGKTSHIMIWSCQHLLLVHCWLLCLWGIP